MPRLSGKSSEVWRHFDKPNNGSQKAKCAYCRDEISFKGGGSSNLLRHMKRKHSTIAIALHAARQIPVLAQSSQENQQQQPLQQPQPQPLQSQQGQSHPLLEQPRSSSSTASFNTASSIIINPSGISNDVQVVKDVPVWKSKQLNEQLVKVIAKEFQPFSLVEDEEFKKFIYMLCPGYELPTRKTISTSLVPELYTKIEECINKKLARSEYICLTTDGWTSDVSNQSYYSVTCNFIDQENQIVSLLLGCTYFEQRHTGENIATFLTETVNKWNMNNKIVAAVTNNASNMISAIKKCEWNRISCFAHNVNLVVQEGLSVIRHITDKVKKIVQYLKKSSRALVELKSAQTRLGLPLVKLKLDVSTRWNSTYEMLNRISKIKNAVISVLAVEMPSLNTISDKEWDTIDKCINILKVFEAVTTAICGEKHLTISKTLVFVSSMREHIGKIMDDPMIGNELEHLQLCIILNEGLKKRFDKLETDEILSQAAYLDPRFKKYAFSSDIAYKNTYKAIQLLIESTDPPQVIVRQEQQTTARVDTSLLYKTFYEKIKSPAESHSISDQAASEIQKYESERLLDQTENPLKWWYDRRDFYPKLFQLAKKRLCVLATSVPSERLFSKAGQKLTDARNRLSPEKLEKLLFINCNLDILNS